MISESGTVAALDVDGGLLGTRWKKNGARSCDLRRGAISYGSNALVSMRKRRSKTVLTNENEAYRRNVNGTPIKDREGRNVEVTRILKHQVTTVSYPIARPRMRGGKSSLITIHDTGPKETE